MHWSAKRHQYGLTADLSEHVGVRLLSPTCLSFRVTPLDAVNGVAVRKQQVHADGSRGNGRRIQAPVDAAERIVLAVASGQAGREELVGWLEEYITMADTNRVNCDAYYACDPPLQSLW